MPNLALKWTPEETNFVINNYPKLRYYELAIHLNKTICCVKGKVQLLKESNQINYLKKVNLNQGKEAFKIWETKKEKPEYILADTLKKALELFLKQRKIVKKVIECEQHEAIFCCQKSDKRRTKLYYKYI